MQASQRDRWAVWHGTLSAIVVSLLAGCGEVEKATAHLQGAVTLAGKPLPTDATGSVSFTPTSREQAPAATAEVVGGRYDCLAAPQGAVRVSFNIMQPTGPEYTTERGVTTRNTKDLTPAKYAAGIDDEISGDNAEKNYDLQ